MPVSNIINKDDIKIYNQDCFNIFPEIKDNSIDMVLVDLPYTQTSCKWDCMIDLDEMWVQLKRICKKQCNYVFFCTTKFGYQLIKSNEKWFRYDLVWYKNKKVGFLNANKMPLRNHEMIYVFSQNGVGKKTYNPQKTKGKPYTDDRKGKRKDMGVYRYEGKKYIPERIENKGDRHPTSILEVPRSATGSPKIRGGKYNDSPYGDFKDIKSKNDGTKHPPSVLKFNNPKKSLHRTMKPTKLLDFLVKSYTNQGDTIIDFTCGSGSTGISCLRNKRKVILIEKDKDIYEICSKRINKYLSQDHSWDEK